MAGGETSAPLLAGETIGPWGKIEYYQIVLEPPTTHLTGPLFDDRSYWNFGAVSQEEVYDLFRSFHFSAETLELIRSGGKWLDGRDGIEVEVEDAIIESLSPANRSSLANWFQRNNENFYNKVVSNLEGGNFSAFEDGKVRPETLEFLKRVSFYRGNVLSMMDVPYIMGKLGDDHQEKENFLRGIFATRGLVVRLVVDDSSDLTEIIEYWSRGGINPGVKSILKGVQASSKSERIDIVHLLPPVPRRYLYGFTNLQDAGPSRTPDCFWTSVQFFKRIASPRLLDPLLVDYYLDYEFERVEGDLQFGDMVCMVSKENGNFLHSYVHIADDIVFTKNGLSFSSPFILTRKADMLSIYADDIPVVYEVYRRKKGT